MKEYGLDKIVKLGSNENNYSPFNFAMKAMEKECQRINVYPEKNYVRLKQLLGEKFGLDEDYIGLGHGAGNVLDTIAKTFLDNGDEVIIPRQSYSLYKEISWIMGAEVKFVDLDDDYKINLDKIKEQITEKTKLIWLCNPNNPTGTMCDKDKIKVLLDALPEHAWIILDEAYIEFADKNEAPDTIEMIKSGERIMSVRTFSKMYGLAGQRIGYVISTPEFVNCYDTVSEPFNSNRIGLACAVASLRDGAEEINHAMKLIINDRKMMCEKLKSLGCELEDSHTNFLFFKAPYSVPETNERLLQNGVIVRPATGWGYENHIRVSIGTTEENMEFLRVFEKILKEMGGINHVQSYAWRL